jgi:hypothetical protein
MTKIYIETAGPVSSDIAKRINSEREDQRGSHTSPVTLIGDRVLEGGRLSLPRVVRVLGEANVGIKGAWIRQPSYGYPTSQRIKIDGELGGVKSDLTIGDSQDNLAPKTREANVVISEKPVGHWGKSRVYDEVGTLVTVKKGPGKHSRKGSGSIT